MKKAINFLSKEEFLIGFFSLLLLLASYLPLAQQYLSPRPGKVFFGSVGFPVDFWGNIIVMQEGRLGQMAFTAKLTSTLEGPQSYVKVIYNILGFFSRPFAISNVIFFHISRLILSIFFIFTVYWFISKIIKEKAPRIGAFLLAFFSTSTAYKQLDKLTDFWSPLSVFQRSAYYHHYLVPFILVFFLIFFLGKFLTFHKPKDFILASTLGFVITSIHLPITLSLFLSLPFYVIIDILKNKKFAWKNYLFLFLFCLITSLPIIYLFMVSKSYPMNLFSKVESQYNLGLYISVPDFIIGIGPTLFLSFVGAFIFIKKKAQIYLLLAPWSFIYILGFYFLGRIFNLNGARFIQTPFFVFLGIFSAMALWKLFRENSRKFYLSVLLVLLLSSISYWNSIHWNTVNFRRVVKFVDLPQADAQAINWFKQNTNPKIYFLSDEITGLIIPALAGNTPYVNLQASSLPYEEYHALQINADNFLSEKFTESEAKDFLTRENLGYVYSHKKLKYSFIKEIYQNQGVIIYSR